MSHTQRNLSLLRQFVQPITADPLGIKDEWTWAPEGKLDVSKLAEASPTTEYSTENGED